MKSYYEANQEKRIQYQNKYYLTNQNKRLNYQKKLNYINKIKKRYANHNIRNIVSYKWYNVNKRKIRVKNIVYGESLSNHLNYKEKNTSAKVIYLN